MSTQRFWRWFEEELARRGFRSVRQVERAGGVGNDTVSGRHRRGLEPTDTVIRAIADAFGMTFEAVQQAADAPSEAHEEPARGDLTLRELWGIVSHMSVEDQRAVLDYAQFRQSRTGEPEEAGQRPGRVANPQTPLATDGG
jgi:hypothetical protein